MERNSVCLALVPILTVIFAGINDAGALEMSYLPPLFLWRGKEKKQRSGDSRGFVRMYTCSAWDVLIGTTGSSSFTVSTATVCQSIARLFQPCLAAVATDNYVPVIGVECLARSGIGARETVLAGIAGAAGDGIEGVEHILGIVLRVGMRTPGISFRCLILFVVFILTSLHQ
jgi:hypothetical protein